MSTGSDSLSPSDRRIVWGVGTPRTLRVHWALRELGLEYETRPIGSRTGETQTDDYLARNPHGKIPTLEDRGRALIESAAIVTYLGETYDPSHRLVPAIGTPERQGYFEWSFFVMNELDAHSLYVIRRHGDLADLYGEAPNALTAAGAYFEKHVAVVERRFDDGRAYVLGAQFSGADILLHSCLVWGEFLKLSIGRGLDSYRSRINERAAYREALSINFPQPAA